MLISEESANKLNTKVLNIDNLSYYILTSLTWMRAKMSSSKTIRIFKKWIRLILLIGFVIEVAADGRIMNWN